MSFEVKGKLDKIFDTINVNDSFKKREFVLEIPDGNFTQFIKFQLTQDKCDLVDDFQEGQDVQLTFSLRGKPFQNRDGKMIYFNNLNVWRMSSVVDEPSMPSPPSETPIPELEEQDDVDDLPF